MSRPCVLLSVTIFPQYSGNRMLRAEARQIGDVVLLRYRCGNQP